MGDAQDFVKQLLFRGSKAASWGRSENLRRVGNRGESIVYLVDTRRLPSRSSGDTSPCRMTETQGSNAPEPPLDEGGGAVNLA